MGRRPLDRLAVLGRARRQHEDWFDGNDAAISNLLAMKNRLLRAFLNSSNDANNAAFYQCRRLAQQRLQETQDYWMARKTDETQEYANRNKSKNFFTAIMAIYGPLNQRRRNASQLR
nr:unnamed protein product [Spirometra erinaceieuropaei]